MTSPGRPWPVIGSSAICLLFIWPPGRRDLSSHVRARHRLFEAAAGQALLADPRGPIAVDLRVPETAERSSRPWGAGTCLACPGSSRRFNGSSGRWPFSPPSRSNATPRLCAALRNRSRLWLRVHPPDDRGRGQAPAGDRIQVMDQSGRPCGPSATTVTCCRPGAAARCTLPGESTRSTWTTRRPPAPPPPSGPGAGFGLSFGCCPSRSGARAGGAACPGGPPRRGRVRTCPHPPSRRRWCGPPRQWGRSRPHRCLLPPCWGPAPSCAR